MDQPNFQTMSSKELRAYMLAHRDDNEALETYRDRRTPNSCQHHLIVTFLAAYAF